MADSVDASEIRTHADLCAAARAFAETVDIDVPLDAVEWRVSERAKRIGGRIDVRHQNGEIVDPVITLAWNHFRVNGWEAMQKTIIHELVHYWEYVNFGESDHGARFKRKTRELGGSLKCNQHTEHRYQLSCLGCGGDAGGRHNRSKIVQQPERVSRKACDCDAGLLVEDMQTEQSWTDKAGFKRANPSASVASSTHRYILSCAHCETEVARRKQKSKTVKQPHHYRSSACDCSKSGLKVLDVQTGMTWVTSSGCP
jgi:predicted SprT family Zn-dependent metalloprotease